MTKLREFTVRIDPDLLGEFDRVYPAYGSRQWFIEACIKSAVKLAEQGVIEMPEQILDRVVREADKKLPKRY